MRRTAKVKVVAVRFPQRKAAMSAGAASRRGFPAWIDAGERGVAFHAVSVMPRIRAALVLRVVARENQIRPGSLSDVHGAR